jgi:arylsulfatase A-like enzyme
VDTHGAALYWELIHVPLVIWYPGHVPAGLRIERPVSNAAIAATVMDLIGNDNENKSFRPSLTAFWKNPALTTNWPNPLAELAQDKYLTKLDKSADPSVPTAVTGAMNSVVTPEWQLITHEKFGDQLYDWRRDPGETHNVAAMPEGQKAAADLTLEIEKQRR